MRTKLKDLLNKILNKEEKEAPITEEWNEYLDFVEECEKFEKDFENE